MKAFKIEMNFDLGTMLNVLSENISNITNTLNYINCVHQ